MMKRRTCLFGVLVATALAFWGVDDAEAQAVNWRAGGAGFWFLRDGGSARLDAMGGLRIVVRDEGNELNLSDYGRNLSGILRDSDGRRWETWTRSIDRKSDWRDEDGVRTRDRQTVTETGGRITWRKAGSRFLGIDIVQNGIVGDVERGEKTNVRGPWWGGMIGQAIGRFTVSGAVRLQSDNEDLRTDNIFAVRHRSSGVEYTGAISYRFRVVEVGLQGERRVVSIDGVSRDEARFHQDELTWHRPETVVNGVVLFSPNDRIEGALRMQVVDLKGRQEVEVSWSDRMPDNAGRENFRTRAGTFDEEVTGFSIGTRWQGTIAQPLLVAVDLERSREDEVVTEGHNFKGSRRNLDFQSTMTHATAGAGYGLHNGRFRLGVEGSYDRLVREETLPEGSVEVAARTLGLHTGAEYFLTDRIALRGGYIRYARDDDLDRPRSLLLGNAWTAGVGYIPRGGLFQIDLGVRFQDLMPDYDGDPSLEESEVAVSMTARLLL